MISASTPRRLTLLAGSVLLLSIPAFAQTSQEPAAGVETPPPPALSEPATPPSADDAATLDTTATDVGTEILTEESENQVLAAKIIGKDVTNMAGEQIATVEDVLLDKSGQVSGLVIKSGGVLGVGGKVVAITWQDLGSADSAEAIAVDLTAEQIEAAPEFVTKEEQQAEAMQEMPAQPAIDAPASAPATTQ